MLTTCAVMITGVSLLYLYRTGMDQVLKWLGSTILAARDAYTYFKARRIEWQESIR